MRRRLQDNLTPERRVEIYSQPYHHHRWEEHITRVNHTIDVGTQFARQIGVQTIIDLACGDGAIAQGIAARLQIPPTLTLGTLVGRDDVQLDVIGAIEDTLPAHIMPRSKYDLFICTETIEHLNDPDEMLANAHLLANNMLLTTPCGEHPDGNSEHIWEWDQDGIAQMLDDAGWDFATSTLLKCDYYTYQIWTVS